MYYMPQSVRLDPESEAWVRREARRRGTTRSDVIRLALRDAASAGDETTSPYDVIADLVGSWRSGRGDLSERTGERYARLLAARKR